MPGNMKKVHIKTNDGWTTLYDVAPSITLSSSQIISYEPLILNLTAEQQAIVETLENSIIKIDVSAFYTQVGLDSPYAWIKRNSTKTWGDTSNGAVVYEFTCDAGDVNINTASITKLGTIEIYYFYQTVGSFASYSKKIIISVGKINLSKISDATNIHNGSGTGALLQEKSSTTFTINNPNSGRTGDQTVEAAGNYSIVEGGLGRAEGAYSHVEGETNITAANCAHAEGYSTFAGGVYAHTEGLQTTATGSAAHAEGISTIASGDYSHAEGSYTTANHRSQHVFGEYNTLDPSSATISARGNYVEIVGNGTGSGTNARSNARTLDWSGNEYIAGNFSLDGNITLNNSNSIEGKTTAGSSYSILGITDGNNIRLGNANLSNGVIIAYNTIRPTTTNSKNLGSSSNQWNAIYGKTLYENGTSLVDKYASNKGLISIFNKTEEGSQYEGWYKLATVTYTAWKYINLVFLVQKSYSVRASAICNLLTYADSANGIASSYFNVMSASQWEQIKEQICYVKTYDSNNKVIQIDIYAYKGIYDKLSMSIISLKSASDAITFYSTGDPQTITPTGYFDISNSCFLPLTGGTLLSTETGVLTLKRNASSGGAFLLLKNNNQNNKFWFAGMRADDDYQLAYTTDGGSDTTTKFQLSTGGNITQYGNQYDVRLQSVGTLSGTGYNIGTTKGNIHIGLNATGSGSSISDGKLASLTFGGSGSAYAGIYTASSGSYGTTMILATTNSFNGGSYGRITIGANGNVAIGGTTLSPNPAYNLTIFGQTYIQNDVPNALILRRPSANGTFVEYQANNQGTKKWRSGVASDYAYSLYYTADAGTTQTRYWAVNTVGEVIGNTSSGTNPEIRINRTYTQSGTEKTTSIAFGIGSGNTNRGIYDHTGNRWMIYADQNSAVFIPDWASIGNANTPVYFSSGGRANVCTGVAKTTDLPQVKRYI